MTVPPAASLSSSSPALAWAGRAGKPITDAAAVRLRALLLAEIGACALLSLQAASIGRVEAVVVALIAVSTFFALRAFGRVEPRSKRLRFVAHLNLSVLVLILTAGAFLDAQGASLALWYLPLLPFIACPEGVRATAAWTVLMLAAILVLHGTGVFAPVAPEPFAGSQHLLDRALVVSLAFACTAVAKLAFDSQLARLAEREEVLRQRSDRLRHAHELLEAVTAGADAMVAALDPDLRYTYLNRAYQEQMRQFVGLDIQVGASLLEVLADQPALRSTSLEEWRRALAGETSSRTFKLGDRVFSSRKVPLRNADGAVVGAGEVAVDVTDQVQAREALRESEERFRSLADAIPQLIWLIDPDGASVYWNRRLAEYTGCCAPTAEEHERLVHPQDRERFRECWRAARALEEDFECEYRLRRRDGEHRWFLARAVRRLDPAGDPVGWIGSATDIHDLRRAREQLGRSERKHSVILEAANSGFCRFDLTGKILEVNEAYCRMSGFSRAELGRMRFADLDVSGSADEVATRIRLVRQQGHQEFENRHRRKDGTVFDAEVHATHLDLEGGQVVAFVWDISERKAAEQALRAANQRLAEADERKNEFLAVLSHELRNPLAPITNSLFVLDRAEPGGAKARRALDVIRRQVHQLTRLVDDLLDLTRISRNKIQLRSQRLDLTELVRHTADDHRAQFHRGDVRLEVVAPPGPVTIEGDWNRLAQVVGNLLTNAAKFTPRGGRTLVLLAVENGTTAILCVADTGVGLSPQMLSRLFQPFMQADATLDRSKGGLGLGLALVKSLVGLHGGEVSVRSDGLGRGAEFTVRIPLALPVKAEVAAAPPAPVPIARRVLIIEDNTDAANTLCEVLTLSGHEVSVAYDGPSGLAAARALRPDVALCDIGLPGMDGFAVARAFRADEALKDVFLVALSGYARPEDLQRASAAGFQRHLAKPPDLDRLEQLLASSPIRPTKPRLERALECRPS